MRPRSRTSTLIRAAAAAAAAALALVGGLPQAAGAAPPDTAAASGGAQRVVTAGPARFEVLTPTLIRMEYAEDGRFEDGPTFNVIDRDLPVPRFRTAQDHGWLVISTDRLTLRYQEGAGPFTAANTSVTLTAGGTRVTARPSWPAAPGHCAVGTVCQAEDGRLNGGESVTYDHAGFTGRGFAADRGQQTATDAWTVTGVPAEGDYVLRLRYANGGGDHTLSVAVGGAAAHRVTFPHLADWDTWGTVSVPVHLAAGDTTVSTTCAAGDDCNVNLDSVAVTAPGAAYPTASSTSAPQEDLPGQLGGWSRGLDAYTNQAGDDLTAYGLHPGILNRQGWSLLDDTHTALRTPDGWAQPRPGHQGAYQDGYFFGYGHDYQQALRDLRAITGPAAMLPASAFGVWFSEYNAFTTDEYEKKLLPAFRANDVPVDNLVVDTDWKSPQQWDGWNWNPSLFPDPKGFLDWAAAQHLGVALNVHAGIDGSDPRFAQAQATAGGALQHAAQCFSPDCYRFDWSDPKQARAWFDLHRPFEQQGVRQWWLDWCCTDSLVGMAGLTPDSWINELYAKDLTTADHRGFNLARLGSSFEDYRGAPAPGPWGEHRSTVHFTGDTEPTWDTLAYEVHYAPDEASIGLPWVSHDIGSFKGRHLPDDLYARWVQLGAFQPVLRLHSDHGDRLPWDYGDGREAATDALRLREALAPYTYSLAWDAHRTGLPLTRPLYLDYPELDGAYTHPGEYLYGPDVLVAPVTTPGKVATKNVWFPPGRWTDWFTGATYTGPATATLRVPLNRMPVFVKAGGIVPQAPGRSHVDPDPAALSLKVYAGDSGSFTLHTDAGDGSGYQAGEYADTVLGYRSGSAKGELSIGAAGGRFPGQRADRTYTVDLADVTAPRGVAVDGRDLPQTDAGTAGAGWWYDAGTATLHVRTPVLSTGQAHTVTQTGGQAVQRPAPAAVDLSLDPTVAMNPGAPTTVTATLTDAGPGAVSGAAVTLTAPDGWTVTPGGGQSLGTLAEGGSATARWTVTAPPGTDVVTTGALKATATYISDATGSPGEVTTYQNRMVLSFGERVGGLTDPAGDDNGPGGYVYPADGAFNPGSLDLTDFDVYRDGDKVRMVARVAGAINNPWGGQGMSTQRINVYVHDPADPSTAPAPLLPGTNMSAAGPWTRAVVVDGRHQQSTYGEGVYGPDGTKTAAAELQVVPATRQIVVTMPASAFAGTDLAAATYQVSMFSDADDGEGIGNVRPVYSLTCYQGGDGCPWFVKPYRFGGGAGSWDSSPSADTDTRDPNAIDVISGGTPQSAALDWTAGAPVVAPYVPLTR